MPPTPKTSIWSADFENQVYTLEGSSCLVSDLFDVNWGYGSWEESAIVEGGATGDNVAPVVKENVLHLMCEGVTIVSEFTLVDEEYSGRVFSVDFANTFDDWSQSYYLTLTTGSPEGVLTWDGPTLEEDSAALPAIAHGVRTKFAATFKDGHLACSINGGETVSVDVTDPEVWDSMGAFGFYARSQVMTHSIACLTWRSDSELRTLSSL